MFLAVISSIPHKPLGLHMRDNQVFFLIMASTDSEEIIFKAAATISLTNLAALLEKMHRGGGLRIEQSVVVGSRKR